MKRIVLFVEGEGEAESAPILVRKIVASQEGFDVVFVDADTFRVGQLGKIVKDGHKAWQRLLRVAATRRDFCGVLLLLDGDAPTINGKSFCAMEAAINLAAVSKNVGGGRMFSVACVFACQEFESWFIAAAHGFEELPDGRKLNLSIKMPENPEVAPRDAKKLMKSMVSTGYKPTQDQAIFAQRLDIDLLRSANIRSFLRLEKAISELISAARSGEHFVSPIINS